MPEWSTTAGHATPVEWLCEAIGQARVDASAEARAVGEQLHDLAFGVPEIATLFQRTRGVAGSRGAQVLVRVLAAPQALSAWPWELLIDPHQTDGFLTMARDTHVVRAGRARTYPVRQAAIAPPLQLLLVLSSPLREGPTDTETPFDLYEEKRSLLGELAPLVERGLLRVEVEDRPSIERLRSRMGAERRGFHVLHYLGHAQPAGLKLEQRTGRGRIVPSAEFSRLLQQLPDLRLAVFAGCETARAPADVDESHWPGQLSTADYCVRDACPMVVGMQAVLPFGTERLFTRYFYQAVTGGQTVAEAARLARLAIADDEHAGGRLLNWAVPCLFVGGSQPVALVDPDARAVAPPPQRRTGLRLGVRQGELRFISRLAELREAVDVLSSLSNVRLLMVVGLPGTGKTAFLDRAVEELDAKVAYLLVSVERLLEEEDALQFLCQRVAEVVGRTGRKTPPQGRDDPRVWWERLLEVVADTPLALALDDADRLRGDDERVVALREALIELTQRRGRTRLALAGSEELAAMTTPLGAGQVRTIRLQALSWPEVWQWIRRNLPVLTRFGESNLAAYYADLPRLEDWERLADAITSATATGDVPALVRRIGADLGTPSPTAAGSPPPVFGETASAPASGTAAPVAHRTLRVAVAGPHTEGRTEEFARGITQFAAEHHVAGRVVGAPTADGVSRLAELLPLDSPFGADGRASMATITTWLDKARAADANVILLDFGSNEPSSVWDRLLGGLASDGRLVIAAGGIGQPTYPAWCAAALGVGALEPDGTPAAYSIYDPEARKPELYAPKTVDNSPLEVLVAERGAEGPSFAAMYAVAAAIVVWATDRGLSADDVRATLVETAKPLTTPKGEIRCLDVAAALRRTRHQLLLDALEWRPLGLYELLAETGMRPELALPILDHAVERHELRRVTRSGDERYENPDAVYLAYGRLRDAPDSPTRTAELSRLIERVRTLARRGRYQSDEVAAMWDSGVEARRVSALAVMQAVPQLGSVDIVADAIAAPRTPLEQCEALRAALALSPSLAAADRRRVRDAIEGQRRAGGTISPRSDQRALAKQVLDGFKVADDADASTAGLQVTR
jgi:hypothetical protein